MCIWSLLNCAAKFWNQEKVAPTTDNTIAMTLKELDILSFQTTKEFEFIGRQFIDRTRNYNTQSSVDFSQLEDKFKIFWRRWNICEVFIAIPR